jgi:hypothetical protein
MTVLAVATALSFSDLTLFALPQPGQLVGGFPLRWHAFEPGSGYVGFVIDKVALLQVFFEYFRFPCQSFRQSPHPS